MESQEKQQVITWINNALRNQHFEKLEINFPVSDCKGGFIAEVVFADVIAEKNGTTKNIHLIIKKNKGSEVLLQEMNLKDAYINEINVYSKFIPYLKKFAEERNTTSFENLPHCYGTINNHMEYVVILENLKPAGYKVHEIKVHQDMKHAQLVLAAYAKWHALWFAVKDQEPKAFEEFIKCNAITTESKIADFINETMRTTLNFIIESYKKKNKLELAEKLIVLRENLRELMNNAMVCKENEYAIIRHGDSWNNNYLFHYNEGENDPDKVSIIDWQMATLASPGLELVLYLFNCCSKTELKHLDRLLEFYYDRFSKKMKELGSDPSKCFPFEVLLSSFQKYAPCAIVIMPMFTKMGFLDESHKYFDFTVLENETNLDAIFSQQLTDPEGYFDRVNGILEICVQRGLM